MLKRMTWEQITLIPLGDGKPTQLKSIYEAIGKNLRDGYINPSLFNINPDYGNRAKFTHCVRSTMKTLAKHGFVQHVGKGRTGIYKITESGKKHLSNVEP